MNLIRNKGKDSMTDIRKETCIIIRKNSEYLVGTVLYSNELRWTTYQHQAWRTRNREKAAKVAKQVGGVMVLFNPIVNQMKVMGC